MSETASDLVKVKIDDREIEVPKGTGLVETAAAAGIEIPVFCYEPRLGPPVGACRMCLVEVEGLPKLQAGCGLTAQDGMVVKTAATSEKAAEGQNATLEFILVNHPLDCPVCDKGGECPLQDLTFRYGPGNTRMSFSKITLEKPIPVSPLIALDRERCILCYRCTRFSSDVAEDNQLVARNRGAHTEITTFESDPYRAPFSGNVIELCPVGALTSTQYRFEARPWDIQNVPTVCGLCPVGCNINATVREGKVKRILSRNHPEVDGGWLCDKGRFTYPHLTADDRITEPLQRGELGFEAVSWDSALDRAEELLRGAGTRIVTALSGSETLEQAYALARLLRGGLGAHAAVLPESTSDALDAFRLPLSALAEAELVVLVGDDDVAERAPVVDLWLKAARRNGAEITHYGPTGNVPTGPGGAAAALRALAEPGNELGAKLRGAERAILVWSGSGGGGGARLAEAAHALGFEDKPGSGAFHLPATPNGRGVAAAWAAAADEDDANPEPIGAADRLRRRGRRRPGRAGPRRAGRERDRDHDVPRARGRLGRSRPAGHERARARRHPAQPRGPPAAPPSRSDRSRPRRARLDREARRALRRRRLASRGGRLRRALRAGLRRRRRLRAERDRPPARAHAVRGAARRHRSSTRRLRRSPPESTSSASSGSFATARSSPGRSSSASASSPSSARRPSSSSRRPMRRGARSRPATRSS